jgi:hypothetical protein
MTTLPAHLDALGRDLDVAMRRLVARRRRRSLALRTAAAGAGLVLAFSAAAVASGIGPDLQLDPTKWSLLGGGGVDEGRGEYVHAQRLTDGSHSTFMVEHDQGLDRYAAFLLHERLRAAADESSPVPVRQEAGALCTRAELTRAEQVSLTALRASFDPGAPADATKGAVDAALASEFAASPCRGLAYAGELARLVYAGVEPVGNLMAGVR